MTEKKGLSRGLDDLMETHDVDLPFLDAYGTTLDDHTGGITQSGKMTGSSELLTALVRHLKSEGASVEQGNDNAIISDWMKLVANQDGVMLTCSSESALPVVPTDLQSPGFKGGSLSNDRDSLKVLITSWGVESRRLTSRLLEYHNLLNQ